MAEGTNVSAKEYGRMQKLLLLVAGCIAIDQTLLSVVILLAMLAGAWYAWKERKIPQLRIWPRCLKWLLFLLLAAGYISLHNPLVTNTFACTFNYFYVYFINLFLLIYQFI